MIKKLFLCLSIASSTTIFSNDDFLSLLDEVSEIATKTKMNIDYQPSVVSVFDADKLKRLGVNNLYEAIGLLPGVETSILHVGWKQVIIRGNYNPDTYIFDKYKLYVDGMDVGSNLYSTSYYYLDLPIELIDKIEILRGSASTIYGPGAFSGAINVITKISQPSETTSVFTAIGSYDYTKAGFIQKFELDNWNIGIDGYHQHNNKKIFAGESFVEEDERDYSRSDYNSLEGFEDFSIGLLLSNDNFKIKGRYKQEKTQNYYGFAEFLEPVNGGYQLNKSGVLEVQNDSKISKDVSLDTKVGLNYYSFSFDSTVYKSYLDQFKMRFNPTYSQMTSYLSLNILGENLENHSWLFGAELQKVKTLDNTFGTTMRINFDDGPIVLSPTLVYLSGEYGFLEGDKDQVIKSVYFQDIYSINQNLDISLNARLDDYSLFEKMYSYRIGSVYRLDDNNIFKATYGRSFRAPSFVEAFQAEQSGFKDGNPNLKPEVIDTYEIAYTYKNENKIFRGNLFYSTLQDVIDSISGEPDDFVGDYSNHKERNAKGLELEFTYSFNNGAELNSNFSYVKTQYYTPNYSDPQLFQSPLISEYMFKTYLFYPLTDRLSINSTLYHNGPKKGMVDDSNIYSSIKASTIFNETISYDIV
jgi:iron complex outermembrane receptor protein